MNALSYPKSKQAIKTLHQDGMTYSCNKHRTVETLSATVEPMHTHIGQQRDK